MAYSKTHWNDGAPPAISAANLNKIEDGIENNDTRNATQDGRISAVEERADAQDAKIATLETDVKDILPTDTASGEIASFPDGSDLFDYLSCVVDIEPLQDLHGYDSPWVGGAGKNKFGGTYQIQFTLASPIPSGTSLVASANAPSSGAARVDYFDANGNRIDYWSLYSTQGGRVYATFTATADVYRIGFYGAEATDYMVEIGTTPTAYAPWENLCPITGWTGCEVVVSPTEDAQDGTTYPVSWQTEAGTVYGGTVDVVSGMRVLTDRRLTKRLTSAETITLAQNGAETTSFKISSFVPVAVKQNNAQISSHFTFNADADVVNPAKPSTFVVGASRNAWFQVPNSIATTVDAFKSWIDSQTITVSVELATPITYQLDPVQVACLSGQNNVWADCGDVEVTYKADVQKWVEKKLGE